MLGQWTTYIFLMRSFDWYIWKVISVKEFWYFELTKVNLILTMKCELFPLDYMDTLPENKVAGNRPFTYVFFSPHINLYLQLFGPTGLSQILLYFLSALGSSKSSNLSGEVCKFLSIFEPFYIGTTSIL